MTFAEIYKSLCEKRLITNVSINPDSFKTVEEAIEKKIITNVQAAQYYLNEDKMDGPEVENGKASASTADDVNKAFAKGAKEVNVVSDLKTDSVFNMKTDSSKVVFDEKQTGAVTINANETSNFLIEAPKGMAELNVQAPTTTVTVGNGTFEKVSAATADYTLVLEPGVVINNLNVVAGNILVKKGASVKAITKDASNKNVVVVYTDGNPSSFDIPAAQPGAVENVWYKVSEVLGRGGKMILTDDAKLSPTSSSEFYGELDLNGHNLTVMGRLNSAVVKAGESLKIYNGNISTTDYKQNKSVFKTSDNSVLEFNKVNFNTEGSSIFADGEESHVIVKDSIFNSFYAIATNASTPKHMTIDLADSKFTGMSTVFVNVPCDLNITNCEINGQMHGVIVRGGNANISNSTINMDYKDSDFEAMASYFDSRDWASGNTINLAGLVMGNKDKSAYKYPTSVNLVNTNISVLGHADLFPPVYAWAYDYPVTFNYDDNCKFNGQLGLVYGNNGNNITVNNNPVQPAA